MIECKQGKFMCDCTTGSHGVETILDYQLSWVLRCAADRNLSSEKPELYHQCITIFMHLIDPDKAMAGKNVSIESVKVWKQWEKIDLIANIIIKVNGVEERHVLVIEDKAYTHMTEHQRDDYPELVKSEYDGYDDWKGYHLHLCVVTCHSWGDGGNEAIEELCKGSGWRVIAMENLPDWNAGSPTESDLFNEFWFTIWNPEKC